MPILARQPDIYPEELLDQAFLAASPHWDWWIASTKPRGEKQLITRLQSLQVGHYCPLIPKRYRSPSGRVRVSYIPLFQNYVFLFGDEEDRIKALTTNRICRMEQVVIRDQLVDELRQIRQAVEAGIPLTPEGRLERGNRVSVRSGPFRGFEGEVLRREGKTRLLLTVSFLETGVSMEMDECQLAPL